MSEVSYLLYLRHLEWEEVAMSTQKKTKDTFFVCHIFHAFLTVVCIQTTEEWNSLRTPFLPSFWDWIFLCSVEKFGFRWYFRIFMCGVPCWCGRLREEKWGRSGYVQFSRCLVCRWGRGGGRTYCTSSVWNCLCLSPGRRSVLPLFLVHRSRCVQLLEYPNMTQHLFVQYVLYWTWLLPSKKWTPSFKELI